MLICVYNVILKFLISRFRERIIKKSGIFVYLICAQAAREDKGYEKKCIFSVNSKR